MGSRFFLVQQRPFPISNFQEDFVDAEEQMARAKLFIADPAGRNDGARNGTELRTE
jgi:hypothetical protein